MRKTFLLLSIIALTGCINPAPKTENDDLEKTALKTNLQEEKIESTKSDSNKIQEILLCNKKNQKNTQETKFKKIYELKKNDSYGSCYSYSLIKNGEDITKTLPTELIEKFDCPSTLSLSHQTNAILYRKKQSLKIFDLQTKNTTTLTPLLPIYEENSFKDLTSISCKWNEKGDKIGCVAINQLGYTLGTKLFIFHLNNNRQIAHDAFEKEIFYTCGGNCFSFICWQNNNQLAYIKRGKDGTPKEIAYKKF